MLFSLLLCMDCTGPKSFSASLKAVWWRTTRSDPQPNSCSNIRSFVTNPMRGRSEFSWKITSIARRRKGARKVHLSPHLWTTACYVTFASLGMSSEHRWDWVWVQWQWGGRRGSGGAGGRTKVWLQHNVLTAYSSRHVRLQFNTSDCSHGLAPLLMCRVSQRCAETSSASSRRTRRGRRHCAVSNCCRSSSFVNRRNTSANYWPRGRSVLSSRRSRGGASRRWI